MSGSFQRKLVDIIGILLLVGAVALTLALLSHRPTDTSQNSAGSVVRAENLLGRAGAWTSDFLYTKAGASAFILPVTLAWTGVRLLMKRGFPRLFAVFVALCLIALSTAGISQILFTEDTPTGVVNMFPLLKSSGIMPGGVLGDTLNSLLLIRYFNRTGAYIILSTCLCIGLLLLTSRSIEESWKWLCNLRERAFRRLKTRRAPEVFAGAQPALEPFPRTSPPAPPPPSAQQTPEVPAAPPQPAVIPVIKFERPLRKGDEAPPILPLPPPLPPRPPAPPAPQPPPQRQQPQPAEAPPDLSPRGAAVPVLVQGGAGRAQATSPAAAPPIIASPPPIVTVRPRPDALQEPPVSQQTGPQPPAAERQYQFPSLSMLEKADCGARVTQEELMEKAQQIVGKLSEFGVEGGIEAIHPGPVVTLFEFKPAPGVKYTRILGFIEDLCLGLKAESIRMDRIPGKATVGIEVPNSIRQTIYIREILESQEFQQARSRLTMGLGKRINGEVFLTDLAKMPHLLVAGATGQGKSVGLNTMITSILYKAKPEEVKFIFIDPKRLELGMYADIPHLLTPIVTDAKMAANTLIWAVKEMEERYRLLSRYAVKDIDGFNRLSLENEDIKPIPFIVIVIDELAELLSVSTKEVELCLQRLAQMARAVGIHIVMATQRPSVEVVTGIIKANFPSRISFRLLSKHDSRTILDQVGAEHLLGKGDMLILPPNSSKLIRVHGCFITEDETKKIVEAVKSQGPPQFMEIQIPSDPEDDDDAATGLGEDAIYDEVARFVVQQRKASTSILQRRFRVGYGRAARLMDMLQEDGLVGEADGSRPRDVLVQPDHFSSMDQEKKFTDG